MATLSFCVWEDAEEVALGRPIQENVIDIGATSASGAVIVGTGNRHRRVRIHVDANAFVTWDDNPTATNDGLNGRPMGAENPEYVDIAAGDKIAVIERI